MSAQRKPSEAELAILAWAESHGVTIESEFVPWSQSRAKDDKEPVWGSDPPRYSNKPLRSLQWRVTLKRNARAFLTTEYGAGIAHAPCYMQNPPKYWEDAKAYEARLEAELEQGFETIKRSSVFHGEGVSFKMVPDPQYSGQEQQQYRPKVRVRIEPGFANVLASLAMDSSVLDEGGFEEWAASLGYDTDSRKAESIYRACLEIALKMRGTLGEDGLQSLREACQDY